MHLFTLIGRQHNALHKKCVYSPDYFALCSPVAWTLAHLDFQQAVRRALRCVENVFLVSAEEEARNLGTVVDEEVFGYLSILVEYGDQTVLRHFGEVEASRVDETVAGDRDGSWSQSATELVEDGGVIDTA